MIRVTLGLGCDRDASLETIQTAVKQALEIVGIGFEAVSAVATIDKKSDESAILQLANQYDWPLRFFTAAALARVSVPSPSETVRKHMGTPAVAEAAALLAAGTQQDNLLLEKYKYRGVDGKNATISIAKRPAGGKIYLVGIGPGAREHMSLYARRVIAESDIVIGYASYIKLIEEILEGKTVIGKRMTEELDRCTEACAQAQAGKTVALISSGDSGIYGMAGLTYEVLLNMGWTPDAGMAVEVVPGITALAACASLVGAPLSHDFCSISLSDLMTPWPVIARRLEAAARGDFVVALYNPKSGRRKRQIVEAQRILLRYRRPDTPVAIVKAAYRETQDIQILRLDEMQEGKINMMSTILIGNGSSFRQAGLMITPRGYTNKYDPITGLAKAGEKAGYSLNMGLDGWKACVRRYLRDYQPHSLRDAAHFFDVSIADILSAISHASADDTAGGFAAAAVHSGAEATALEALQEWGRVRVEVRNEAGAVSELLMNVAEFSRCGDWLHVENEHYTVRIDRSHIHQAWLVRRENSLCGIYFTNAVGDSVFNISLVHQDGRFDSAAVESFERAWRSKRMANTDMLVSAP